jgi:hypothetical protein
VVGGVVCGAAFRLCCIYATRILLFQPQEDLLFFLAAFLPGMASQQNRMNFH